MENFSIDYLKNAQASLIEAFEIYSNSSDDEMILSIYADSCVRRFEYTFETSWKFMKKYLKLQYNKSEEELTMNNIFRYMEGYGFTDSWLKWKEYYAQRNNTAHEYSLIKSRKLLEIIPTFIQDVNFLLEKWDSL